MVTRVKSPNDGKFDKGRRGLAEVVKLSDDKLRVDFEATDKEKVESFNVKVELGEDGTVPESFPFKKMKQDVKTVLSVTMNADGDRILFINPASGEFTAKFNKFNAAEGAEPAPETFPGRGGKKDYKAFGALVEIAEGNWKGTNYYVRMYPNFAPDDDGNLAVAGSGSGSDNLYDFLEATGVNKHTLKFSENPLPEIQRIAQAEDLAFKIIVQKGWVDMIVPPISSDAFADEESVDEVHPALKD